MMQGTLYIVQSRPRRHSRASRIPRGRVQNGFSFSRITIDPTVCHGNPCVRGLRYPEALLELLSAGMMHDQTLADYGDLEQNDLIAAIA